MKGEADSRSRPLNSLLEETLDFDVNAKPVPVVTEEVTRGLEDIIKYRIIEGAFDDPVKKRLADEQKVLRDITFNFGTP